MTVGFKSYTQSKNLPLLQTIFGYHESLHESTILGPYSYYNGKEANYLTPVGHSRPEVEGVHLRLLHHYSFWGPQAKYDEHDKKGIYHYTDKGSWEVNHHLWNNRAHNGKLTPDYHLRKTMQLLDKTLHKHTTPEAFTTYTGLISHPEEYLKAGEHLKETGTTYHHPAYLSSSLNPKMAAGFARSHITTNLDGTLTTHKHILQIHIPKNIHGVYVDHVSANSGEAEFILPKNKKIRVFPQEHIIVHHHPETQYDPEETNHYHFWKAHVEE